MNGNVSLFVAGQPLVSSVDESGLKPITASELLDRFHAYGTSALQDLDGHFVVAVWNDRSKTLHLVRDPFGVQSLAYLHTDTMFAFAQNYSALLRIHGCPTSVDESAISHFLFHGWAPATTTFFASIRTLVPGGLLVVRDGTVSIFPPDYGSYRPPRAPTSPVHLAEVVGKSVAAQAFDRQKRYGVMLSSGVDSAVIAASLCRLTPDLHSFTVGYGEDDPEIIGARETAHHLGTVHHELMVTPAMLTTLLPDTIAAIGNPGGYDEFPCLMALHREACRYVDVIFSGNVIDTLFAGMPYHRALPAGACALFEELRSSLVNRDERMGAQELLASAAGLSFRMPYTDRRLIDLGLSTPDTQKLGPSGNKLVFREAARSLLPKSITARPKRIQHLGYGVAMKQWLAEQIERVASAGGPTRLLGKKRMHDLELIASGPLNEESFRTQWNAIALASWEEVFLRNAS